MMRSMFAAISGLKNHQTMLDVTANDIANVNTVGYKSARTTFKDSLAQLQRGGAGASATQGGANPAQVGLGVQLSSIDNVMSTGTFQSTGNALDVAVQGEGFFGLAQNERGTAATQFTRAGNFTRNSNGYLATQDGYFVMGYGANQGPPATPTATVGAINIPDGATSVAIAPNGAVSFIDPTTSIRTTAGFLQLVNFPNPAGLERASGNRWTRSDAAGTATAGQPGVNGFGTTISGVVEMSNVDLSSSFTQMITAQRGFQANSRVISTSDELLQDLVNLKR